MKKHILMMSAALITAGTAMAQSAMDGYQLSQSDMKGTARFMSMGGAFGALGGDLTTLSQNPGGIGIYRSTDIGFTLDLDCQSSTSKSLGSSTTIDQTKFLLNNIGVVATWRMDSGLRNLNFGFTYNKAASFNRLYAGNFNNIGTSLSNYIAGVSNANELTIGDVHATTGYDPYNPNDGGFVSPWISILGYDSYLTNPEVSYNENGEEVTHWYGQMGEGTTGNAWNRVQESGGVDEYNLSFGGNIEDVFFWGMDFGIIDFNYTAHTYYGENLNGAYLPGANDQLTGNHAADWSLYNYYNVNGSGFNYKLGFIVKPIQELRLGFAFHTPTWYTFTQNFYGDVEYKYPGSGINSNTVATNGGYDAYSDFNFRTPWKLIFSAATVQPVLSGLIISADYEWQPYNGMHFSDPYNDGVFMGQKYETYAYENQDIRDFYQQTNTLRLGAELRVSPQVSLRAGYSFVSSPVREKAKAGAYDIYTAGTRPQYSWDNTTNYITAGIGYRYKHFYADAAYVYKHRTSVYHAFSNMYDPDYQAPTAEVASNNSQIVLTMGFRF